MDPSAEYPDRAPLVSPTYDDANPTASAPGATRAAAAGVAFVNVVNAALENYIGLSALHDEQKVKDHANILFAKVADNVDRAMKAGMIPEKYQNVNDIGNIMNVVLQGVNNTKNPDIYKIGMDIYNKYNPAVKNTTIESGLDAVPSKTIIVPEIIE